MMSEIREFPPELIREWERGNQKLDFGDMLQLADYIETLLTEGGLRWISVEDELPPDCSSYAVSSMHLICNDGFVTIGHWYPEEAAWTDSGRSKITTQVTHWMPLPPAPASGRRGASGE